MYDKMRTAYTDKNGADYVLFGVIDTDGITIKAVKITTSELASLATPSITSDGKPAIRVRLNKMGVFNFLHSHVGYVQTVGTIKELKACHGQNDGYKFETLVCKRYGWTPTKNGTAWYNGGDAVDADGRQVQIGFNGKTVCHIGHLETLGLI